MSKFKLPSTKSFRDRIAFSVSQGKGNKDALMAVDYSLAHPSSLEQKLEQVRSAKEARDRNRHEDRDEPGADA